MKLFIIFLLIISSLALFNCEESRANKRDWNSISVNEFHEKISKSRPKILAVYIRDPNHTVSLNKLIKNKGYQEFTDNNNYSSMGHNSVVIITHIINGKIYNDFLDIEFNTKKRDFILNLNNLEK